jgi:hypothetical protein
MRNLKDLNIILEGYTATENGRIISPKGIDLKQRLRNKQERSPYLAIGVWDKRKGYPIPFYVHRLVAFQYCNLELDNLYKLVVNHIDGNKQNNNALNLEWCTQEHNLNEARRIKKLIKS